MGDSAAGDRRSAFLALLMLALLPAVVLEGVVLRGEVLYPANQLEAAHLPWSRTVPAGSVSPANPVLSDPIYQFLPWDRVARRAWRDVRPPTWNPLGGIGAPFLGNPQAAVLDPVRLAALVADDRHAPAVRAWLRLLLAGWFAFGFLRSLGASRVAAFTGAAAFQIGGFMIPWLGHPHAGAALYLPALLWAGDAVFRRTRGAAGAVALVFAAQFFAGHPETSLHVLTIATIYWLARQGFGRRWLPLCGGLAVGGLLAAPVLFPFVGYLARSAALAERSGVAQVPLPWSATATFFWPRLFGWPIGDGWRGPLNPNEIIAFCGVGPWLLAPFAFRRAPRLALGLLGIGAIGLAVACAAPGVHQLLDALPGFRWSANRRMILAVAFAIAALGAVGLDGLVDRNGRPRGHRTGRRTGWGALLVALVGVGLTLFAGPDGTSTFGRAPGIAMIAATVVAAELLVIWLVASGRGSARLAVCLPILIVVELGVHWRGYQPTARPEAVFATAPVAAAIQARVRPEDRVLNLGVRAREAIFPPNTLQSFGVGSLRNYDALGDPVFEARWRDAMAPTPTWPADADAFGARFIVTSVPLHRVASAARIFPGRDHIAILPRDADRPGGPSALVVHSYLVGGERYAAAAVVGLVTVRGVLGDGTTADRSFPMRVGEATAEGAIPQFGARVPHGAPPVSRVFTVRDRTGAPFTRFVYAWRIPWAAEWGRPLGVRVAFSGPDGFLEVDGVDVAPARRRRPVWHEDLFLYRNRGAWPRAFTIDRGAIDRLEVEGDRRAARVVEYHPDRVVIEGEGGPNEALVLTDAADPGWTATVNGDPAMIRPAKRLFRAVDLPIGAFRVVFLHRPLWVFWGFACAGLGVAILLAGWLLTNRRALP